MEARPGCLTGGKDWGQANRPGLEMSEGELWDAEAQARPSTDRASTPREDRGLVLEKALTRTLLGFSLSSWQSLAESLKAWLCLHLCSFNKDSIV